MNSNIVTAPAFVLSKSATATRTVPMDRTRETAPQLAIESANVVPVNSSVQQASASAKADAAIVTLTAAMEATKMIAVSLTKIKNFYQKFPKFRFVTVCKIHLLVECL
jgi:hypothetical protein